ncbi:unnamed protein product [Calypogeia fissa]
MSNVLLNTTCRTMNSDMLEVEKGFCQLAARLIPASQFQPLDATPNTRKCDFLTCLQNIVLSALHNCMLKLRRG